MAYLATLNSLFTKQENITNMKAMTKQQLADSAGVTTKTLVSWCEPFRKELEAMGMQPKMKVLPPHIVHFITEKFDIDVGE